jgi:hypothetical protein
MRRVLCSVLLIAMAPFAFTGESQPRYRDPSNVLHRWSSFQASQEPRLILLVTALPAWEKSGRNISRVRLGTELPETASAAAKVVLSDQIATLPRISAKDAFRELERQLEQTTVPGQEDLIIDAETVIHDFLSDRGFLSLPAWRFRLSGGGSLVWPALPPRFFWRLGSLSPSSAIVQASASRVRSEITVWMDPGRTCGQREIAQPNVRITESESVVLISRADTPRSGSEFSRCIVTADHRATPYTYKLSSPLGGRGLLDELGNVVVVDEGDTAIKPGGPRPTPTRPQHRGGRLLTAAHGWSTKLRTPDPAMAWATP